MSRRVVSFVYPAVVLFAFAFVPALFAQGKPPGRPAPSPPGGGLNNSRMGGTSNLPGTNFPDRQAPLMVKVVFPNERAVGQNIEVQLVATAGNVVNSYFTNSEGEVTFNTVAAGSYRFRIRGPGIVDTTTDTFYLESNGGNRMQWVHVKPEESKDAVGSTQGMVSAAELNVPDKAKKEFAKGNDALVAGDAKKALDHYNKAVQIYPRYGLAYNNIGAAYMQEHDTAHAQEAFAKAVEADPLLGSANANLARTKLLDKKPGEAIPFLERALSSDPKSAEFMFLMSKAQFDSGNFDQAINYALKVHAQDHQKYAAVHLLAGSAYESKNDLPDARTQYELFLKENPEAPQAAQVRAEVNRLNAAAAVTPVR